MSGYLSPQKTDESDNKGDNHMASGSLLNEGRSQDEDPY
jgi:hypothetical protein